jgi:hypothetical protein
MSKKRKLHFCEIGKGRLGKEVQAAFEQAQISARDLNGKTTLVLSINLYPPDAKDGNFGYVDYSLAVREPAYKSMKYNTLLHDGVIINDGDSEAAALQYDLGLELPDNVAPMRGREAIDG